MRTTYSYVVGDDSKQIDFPTNESMQAFLTEHDKETGQLLASNLGLRIFYNGQTGEVKICNYTSPSGVTQFFPNENFKFILLPIEHAVRQRAKHHFLAELYALGDPHICNLIQLHYPTMSENQATRIDFKKIGFSASSAKIDTLFILIAKLVKTMTPPSSVHQAVHSVFNDYKFYENHFGTIQSKQFVSEVVVRIQNQLKLVATSQNMLGGGSPR